MNATMKHACRILLSTLLLVGCTPAVSTSRFPSASVLPTSAASVAEAPAVAAPTATATMESVAPTESPAPQATEPAVDATKVARGIEIYRTYYCGLCHSLAAANTGGTFAPPHDRIGVIAAQRIVQPDYTGAAVTAVEYIRESLLDPQAYVVGGYEITRYHMPAFTHLSEDELDALIYMLLQQK